MSRAITPRTGDLALAMAMRARHLHSLPRTATRWTRFLITLFSLSRSTTIGTTAKASSCTFNFTRPVTASTIPKTSLLNLTLATTIWATFSYTSTATTGSTINFSCAVAFPTIRELSLSPTLWTNELFLASTFRTDLLALALALLTDMVTTPVAMFTFLLRHLRSLCFLRALNHDHGERKRARSSPVFQERP